MVSMIAGCCGNAAVRLPVRSGERQHVRSGENALPESEADGSFVFESVRFAFESRLAAVALSRVYCLCPISSFAPMQQHLLSA